MINSIRGAYMSPCKNYWSSEPFTKEQKAHDKIYNHCEKYNKPFDKLYKQLKNGSNENLPKWVRVWFIKEYEEQKMLETFKNYNL